MAKKWIFIQSIHSQTCCTSQTQKVSALKIKIFKPANAFLEKIWLQFMNFKEICWVKSRTHQRYCRARIKSVKVKVIVCALNWFHRNKWFQITLSLILQLIVKIPQFHQGEKRDQKLSILKGYATFILCAIWCKSLLRFQCLVVWRKM